MADLQFVTAQELRKWLEQNTDGTGVWLLFGKKGGAQTVSAAAALEEALCCGWIDGQMQKIDDISYRKYFAPRRPDSPWSEKNRKLAEQLIAAGRMSANGLARVEEAKADGRWNAPKRLIITEEHVAGLEQQLQNHQLALANYQGMSPSVRRQYAGLYYETKSQEARARRLEKIIGRLEQGLKPM